MTPQMLSEHLSVAEFLNTRDHQDLMPEQEMLWLSSEEIRANAVRLAEDVFEPCRAALAVPLRVTSGLRSPPLNERVGGAGSAKRPGTKPSRHLFGLAVDVVPVGMDPLPALYCLMHAIRRGELLDVDQVIVEGKANGRWLHLQAADGTRPARRLVLTSEDGSVFGRVS
jgi:hypothetical protein